MFIGRRLKIDVTSSYGVLILPESTLITKDHLQLLDSHRIELTESDFSRNDDPDPVSPSHIGRLVDETVMLARDVMEKVRLTHKLPMSTLRSQVIPQVLAIAEQPNLTEILLYLQVKDDYTYRHTVAVGILSTIIGRWLKLEEKELLQLTTAATLHDVGKMRIPKELLDKPGALTEEEFGMMRTHTVLGYDLIKNTTNMSHRQALVALQHHERMDGSGYPLGVSGDQIDLFSRIAAVADVFHAISSKRAYKGGANFYEVLIQLQQSSFGKLDAKIVSLLTDRIMQSSIGNAIRLNDGRKGHIVLIHPHDPIRPLVQMEKGFVDLSKERSLYIEKMVDHEKSVEQPVS